MRGILRGPAWRPALLALAVAWLLVGPWGDYGINDDWGYAEIAKHFAETGRIEITMPSAPIALVPSLVAWPLLKAFGFSHLYLRLITMTMAALAVVALDHLLSHVVRDPSLRLMALLVATFNPLFFYLSTSFMTEVPGWSPALIAAALWFRERRRREDGLDRGAGAGAGADAPVVSWGISMAVAVVMGSTFWTRQWCVLTYPAVLGATGVRLLVERRWRALVRSLPAVGAGMVLFAVIVGAFGPWAKATGNLRPEFVGQLPNLLKFDRGLFLMHSGAAIVYLTAFFLPLLVLPKWDAPASVTRGLIGVAFVGLALYGRAEFERLSNSDYAFDQWTHRTFPYVMNVIYNAGLGPITLDDVYHFNMDHPTWPRAVCVSLEIVFIGAAIRWGRVLAGLVRSRPRGAGMRFEVGTFGALLAVGSLVAVLQAYKGQIVDRYYLPLVFGMAVAIPAALRDQPPRVLGWLTFLALFLPLGWYTVAAEHDQIQWQDARWKLVASALRRGATYDTVQAGDEVNCWFHYDHLSHDAGPCEGGCSCRLGNGFCCVDDRWRVGMWVAATSGYHSVEVIQPHYWLAAGPPLTLSKR
jgi:hypothetical protein